MDGLSVYEATTSAVDRARQGEGPSFIVATTYRYFGHHVGDPLNYRSREEVDEARTSHAIERLKARLLDARIMDETRLQQLEEQGNAALADDIPSGRNGREPGAANPM